MRRFYDIHCHAMNLSHPNFLAVINRFKFDKKMALSLLKPTAHSSSLTKIANLLSIMENDLGDFFLIWEYFIKTDPNLFVNEKFKIAGNTYDKIVLTPLMLDFGINEQMRNTKKIFYNTPPQKPIIEQVMDVFNGIRKYMKYDILISETSDKKVEFQYVDAKRDKKLFEIYPFLGLNTRNLKTVEELKTKILDKYFIKYHTLKGNDLLKKFTDHQGKFAEHIDDKHFDYNFFFAGIKVYPPLNFNPFPDKNLESLEYEKVMYLYKYCEEKHIPITAHCSDGGFQITSNAVSYTNPEKWEKVLQLFPKLKINLAHYGTESKKWFFKTWRKKVIDLSLQYENCYTDLSCQAFDEKFYRTLSEDFTKYPKLIDKMMFGSDFMIHLMWTNSYNEYISAFKDTKYLTNNQRDTICRINSQKFIWNLGSQQ